VVRQTAGILLRRLSAALNHIEGAAKARRFSCSNNRSAVPDSRRFALAMSDLRAPALNQTQLLQRDIAPGLPLKQQGVMGCVVDMQASPRWMSKIFHLI